MGFFKWFFNLDEDNDEIYRITEVDGEYTIEIKSYYEGWKPDYRFRMFVAPPYTTGDKDLDNEMLDKWSRDQELNKTTFDNLEDAIAAYEYRVQYREAWEADIAEIEDKERRKRVVKIK